MESRPPKFWTSLFKRFCHDDFFEELQGDLEEKFYQQVEKYGQKKAKKVYRNEILKMIRPSVSGKPQKLQKLLMFSLFQMNFKLAMRNIVRHKVFSAVNIFGLAGALCVSLFMVNIIYTGYHIDRQHRDSDRIHRIVNYVNSAKRGKQLFASMPYRAVELLKEDIPDLESLTHIKSGFNGSFKVKGEDLPVKGIKVDSAFFEIFNFKVISGNPLAIFADINSVIITDEVANNYFPGQDPLGKQMEQGFVVKAVIASPKKQSHLQFEIIGRLERPDQGHSLKNAYEYDLSYYHRDYAYVKLRAGNNAGLLDSKLRSFSEKVNTLANYESYDYQFVSQPITNIVFGELPYNEPGLAIGSEGLITFLIMITTMLLLASFNYTNLSIARAAQRTKEIGIRKVSGSSNRQIIGQMISETMVLCFISLLIGLSLYKLFSDDFLALTPFIAKIFDSELSTDIILTFVTFTFVTGLIAGVFPALFFSKINPLSLFNPRIKHKKLSFMTIRKVLVTFQLTLSMFCIMFMIMLQKQVNLLKDAPKGFETEDRFIIRTDLQKALLLKSAFLAISGVEAVTITSDVPGDITNGAVTIYDPIDNDTTLVIASLSADEAFHRVLNPKLLDGNFFSPDIVDGLHKEVLVNEKVLNLTNLQLSEAVGTVLTNGKNEYKIVGVLDGMISNNPFMGVDRPFMIVSGKAQYNQSILLLKANSNALDNTLVDLEIAWKELHPDSRFVPETLDNYLHKPMAEFENLIKVMRFLAFTIIAISLLGQLGIALYNAETRVKEIGIRKVLGAKIESIIRLLLRGTIIPILIASAIAGPLAHLLFSQGMAASFRNPLRPGPWLFIQGILLLAAIILLVIVSQTWRVARLNPTESLRNE